MLWTIGICRQEWQVDVDLRRATEFFFGFFCFIFEALESGIVFLEIDAFTLLELFEEMIDDTVVKVFTSEVRVTVG